ncbi:OmpA family protein [Ferribacterium limneticum]|uniref:OmpA family protein n=1 Tax=Ferribacterium limneticum TaxID=76259 RepID=UPI001CF9AA4D|nr:OmpA family protein [Ferribacterium limneticum]UCV28131.1 OmpA family protein [Ferribacterium limneticum]UCV32048.1 OmpA family protein [Ferribacterium limneticum]
MAKQNATAVLASLTAGLRHLVLVAAIPALLGACGGQTIVLVADPEGHVGKAEVVTSGGKQRLERPGEMTRTSGGSNAPSAVSTADPAFIASTFAEALAIEPPPAQTFTLMFETGTATLTESSLKLIPAVVAASERRGAVSVSITGHTDATGSDKVNDALSLDRAMQVKTLLQQKGVNPRLISVSSHGKGNPAIPTPDGVPEPRNRRVVVIVH